MQVLFYLYFLTLPVLFFRGFFDPFEFPRILLTYGFLVLALPVFFFQRLGKPQTLHVAVPDLLVLLFLLFVSLSTLFAQDKLQAFWGTYPKATQSLLFYLALGVFYFLVRAMFDTAEKIKELLVFILIGLGAASVYGIFLYITGVLETDDFAIRVAGTESHPILFGTLMMVGLFLSFSLVRSHLAKLTSLVFLAGVIVAGSRGVFIAALVGLMAVSLLIGKRVLLLTLSLTLTLTILYSSIYPLIHSSIQLSSSTNIRSLELKDALQLAKDKTFPFGIGPSHLPFYYPQYRSSLHNLTNEWSQYPQQVRNNYLDMLIAFGPFALISLLSCYLVILLRSPFNITRFQFYIFLFAGWVALLVHGLFYFYTTSSWIYFWTLTALLVNQASPPRREAGMKALFSIQLKRVITIPLLAGSLVLFLIGGRALIQTFSSELAFTKGLTAYQQISYLAIFSEEGDTNILFTRYLFNENDRIVLQKAVEYFNLALKTVPYPNSLYSRQYIHSLALLGRMQAAPQYYIQAHGQVTQGIKNNPYDLLNFRLRSSISFRMALDGVEKEKYFDIAIDDNQKLTSLDPVNPLNFDNLGLVLREARLNSARQAGKLEEAREAFENSIMLKGDRLPPYLHLAETLEWMGNKKEALEIYQKALEISQNKQNPLILEKIVELGDN